MVSTTDPMKGDLLQDRFISAISEHEGERIIKVMKNTFHWREHFYCYLNLTAYVLQLPVSLNY
jgi:regulation of enolase protein 1 (concanavalin A-like superfamily)